MKKTLLFIIISVVLLANDNITAQSYFKINNGAKVKVLSATDLKASNDLNVANGALLRIYGNVTISGDAMCDDETAIIVHSVSTTQDGSFIYNGGSPKATVQRYVPKDGWHQVAINVSGASCNDFHFDFNPSTWLTHWNESSGEWEYITDITQALSAGEGFDFYVEDENKVVNLKGSLTAADLTLSTSSTPALTNNNGGNNLVGNPYSSAIDVDDNGADNWTFTDLEKTVWVLDQTNGPTNYLSRAVAAGTGSLDLGIIPMGQGFFVHATGSSPSLTIPAARRLHNNQHFYKTTGAERVNVDGYFTLKVSDQSSRDVIWVTFGKNGTDGFENGYDATKLAGGENAPQLFMREESVYDNLSINHLLSDFGDKKLVEVSFECGTAGEQVFTANTQHLVYTGVSLEDLLTGVTQDLTENPVYKFSSTKGDDPDRFLLHFYNTTGVDENNQEDVDNTVQIYSWNKNVYVRNNGDITPGKTLISIYDITGRLLLNKNFQNAPLISVPLNVNCNYAVVRVITCEKVTSSKVVIQ